MTRSLTCLVFLALVAGSQPAHGQPKDAEANVLRAIIDAQEVNRLRFPLGEVAFDYRNGQADALAAAMRGDLPDDHTGIGRYCFDDEGHEFFEKIYPLEAMVATTVGPGPDQGTSPLDSSRVVTNGKLTFIEGISVANDKTIRLFDHAIPSGTAGFSRVAQFPVR